MIRLISLLVAALIALGIWAWGNRPEPVALSFDEPFPSVSFAPYRFGESPITHDYPTPEEIESDMASLKGVTKGIRTYTSIEGMDVVPGLAAKYGLDVTHSAWLGPKKNKNDLNIAALISSANAHPDTIKRVLVGNEVLLRKDLPVDTLIAYIRQVKAAVKQPVSYADVWAFWLQNPQLANEVDFITIHILPYWEDEPVSIDDAAHHLIETYQIIQKAFPGKSILIGESGWPTKGRQRGPAQASVVNAARYVRTLAELSKQNGFDFNLVEAFDQPWKAALEGTIGANWGVVDSLRRVKYSMSGPVEENRDWRIFAGLSVLFGLGFGRCASKGVGKSSFIVSCFAQALAGLVVWQGMNAWMLAYDWLDLAWAVIRFGLHAALATIVLTAVSNHFGGRHLSEKIGRWGERLVTLYGAAAIADTILLLVAGRYRDIPVLEFLVPALGLTGYALLRAPRLGLIESFAVSGLFLPRIAGQGFELAKVFTKWLWACVLIAPVSEAVALWLGKDFLHAHPHFSDQAPLLLTSLTANTEMLEWSAMLILLSLPFAAEWWEQKRYRKPLATSKAA